MTNTLLSGGFFFSTHFLYILEVLLTINQLQWKFLLSQFLYRQLAFTEQQLLKDSIFLLGYFLFSLLAISSLMPTFNEDPYLTLTSLALFLVLAIISFPGKKNISDYKINSEAAPLIKSFVLRTLLSLSTINFIAIFLVKYDTNMPEGITESMRIYPMVMHAVLGMLPFIVLFRLSKK